MAKSPVKWLTDSAYDLLPSDQRAIAQADSQVGVREAGGANKGQRVEEYQFVAGLGKGGGHPWCAAFVYWCLLKAGADPKRLPPIGQCAAVRNWRTWAKDTGRIAAEPARGRLFFWVNKSGFGHIGFCLGPSVLGVFRTIEGNTDGEEGSREGDGVYKRFRTVRGLKKMHRSGFISLTGVGK